MQNIKLISIDLDGTLLDSDRRLPKRNYEAIQMASVRGIEIVISTGSPFELIPHDLLRGLDISYAITANGSAIYEYKVGRCIYEESFDTNMFLPVLEFLLKKDFHMDIFMGGRGYCPSKTYDIVHKLNVPRSRKEYILNNRVWLEDPIAYIMDNQLTVQKITMNFYPDSEGRLIDRAEVEKYLKDNQGISLVSGGWGNLEITKRGVNKGVALIELCKRRNISIEETAAIGDSLNDLDIIRTAEIGVAMKNSMAEVISEADFVTGSNDECGVAEFIEGLCLE